MEMRFLFKEEPVDKYLRSTVDINPSRSPFIKERIKIIYEENSLEELLQRINEDGLSYDSFKVIYIKLKNREVGFEERMNALKKIGTCIIGKAELHNPRVILGLTNLNGKWIFGIYEKNDCKWHCHDKKPHSYSNALSLRMSRALVNIAVGNNLNLELIDPCCGVGTIVLDALSMGINACGYEINKQIARNAKENLRYFGYENVITTGDMKEINKRYDVCIIDIPYGVFTAVTPGEQESIIKKAAEICNKLVIVTFEDMQNMIEGSGFRIIDRCSVKKGGFIRHINVCISNVK